MIVKLFKGWLTGNVTFLMEMAVIFTFLIGVFAVPIILFILELHAGIILFLYLPFLYFWLGPWLQTAQKKVKNINKRIAVWIDEN